ncbi:MAG: FAD:protein FMN transferase ApbE [Gammaproteobacteria bacterium]|nr:FAD:protein FMN transferase ApbE [Gammaproteobacteria bacterium]
MRFPTLKNQECLAGLYRSSISLGLLLVVLSCFAGCDNDSVAEARLRVFGGLTMGTTYSVKINAVELEVAEKKIDKEIQSILKKVNASMSTYIKESELSLLNQSNAGTWITLSEDLYQISEEAMSVSRLTDGHFDISVGALVNLWGFGPQKSEIIPSKDEIEQAMSNSGSEHLQIQQSPPALKKLKDNIYLDLSGIAKGYAVDKIAEYLISLGIDNFLVEIGGEIRASGTNNIGFAWRIGIEQPEPEKQAVRRIIRLDNIAMATSGDYRNYFERDGRRYSHTIDPVSGYPITHNLASVTVLHAKTSIADALATGFLVMGKEAAGKIAQKNKLAVFFIEKTASGFKESFTPEFEQCLLIK